MIYRSLAVAALSGAYGVGWRFVYRSLAVAARVGCTGWVVATGAWALDFLTVMEAKA